MIKPSPFISAMAIFLSGTVLALVTLSSAGILTWGTSPDGSAGVAIVPTALAEDDEEDEHEEEDEDERDDDRPASASTSSSSKDAPKQRQTVTTYEVREVKKVVEVTPEEFTRDSDGDGLVDGIDPHPSIHETEFFTDIDGDGVPNAYDRHHDEDDFSYFDDTDANGNGILDEYESL